MKASLISIGNSKGIRIPQVMLRECRIEDEVELTREDDTIVIKPVKGRPRRGWDRAFKLMHERKDDAALIDEALDMEDWEWK